jgi:hypothetical protein
MDLRISTFTGLTALAALLSCTTQDKGPWQPLFNGTDFSQFEQLGGDAQYRVENGIITGTTVANTENSFMCTRKTYGDFILEYKVLVDTALNSGVQIRSHAYLNGRVHGYQVEIDPAPRAYSGGIYDEARRAWLVDLADNEAGRAAFRNGEWNQYRVEAIGHSIKTWVNGVMCANLVDEADASGFIGFQVHSVDLRKKPWSEGVEVSWKDIRIMTGDLDQYRFKGEDPVPVKETLLTNRLTGAEKEEGWQLLFDGLSMDKWRGVHKDAFPDSGWVVADGILEIHAEGGGQSNKAGDILTLDEYSDFDFCIDFMLTPGANSGIKYFVTEKEKTGGSGIGPEYQLIDDGLNEDAGPGKDGNRTLASLYDLIPASSRKYARAPGQWNMARIVSRGQVVQHWLNGQKVLEYTRGSKEFRRLVAGSKFRVWKDFGEAEAGHILLQEHGSHVSFRNIKIKIL